MPPKRWAPQLWLSCFCQKWLDLVDAVAGAFAKSGWNWSKQMQGMALQGGAASRELLLYQIKRWLELVGVVAGDGAEGWAAQL
jgi:hypothetical protein